MNPLKSYFSIYRLPKPRAFYKFYLNHEKQILGAAGVITFLTVWELVGNTFQLINPMFMSAPSLVWNAAVQLFSSGEIYNDLYVSGVELFWGYILSAVVAVPFGISIGWYKKMSYIFDPFVNAMNATPRVALLPLVIIWLGIGILSKVGIIFLGAVFPISDQYARRSEDHAHKSSYCRQELWRFRVDDLQDRRVTFDYPLHSYRLEARTWESDCGCHGGRALCCHRRDRFHDHRGRCDLPNR